MQRTLTAPPLSRPDTESNPAFNVLIVYEDFDTGKHAKKTYDYLVENLGRECVLTNQMWKFDVLSIPKLREIAVRDAINADIILISTHGGELPAPVTKWIESWLMEGTHALALVALVDDRAQEQSAASPALRTYLSDVAQRGHLEFFAQPDMWPGSRSHSEALLFHCGAQIEEKARSTLAGVVHRQTNSSRWGINE